MSEKNIVVHITKYIIFAGFQNNFISVILSIYERKNHKLNVKYLLQFQFKK